MQFGIHLVRAGVITAEQLVYALERQIEQRPTMGSLAVETRRLTMRQVFEILGEQADSWQPFGQIAVDRGYLNYSQVLELLGLQSERCPALPAILAEAGFVDPKTLRDEVQRYYASRDGSPLDAHARPLENVRLPEAARPVVPKESIPKTLQRRTKSSKSKQAVAVDSEQESKRGSATAKRRREKTGSH